VPVDEVKNPVLEVVKHADPHCMKKVSPREITHDIANILKDVDFSVNITAREFGIHCLGCDIAERSILVVFQPVVLLVRRDILSKLVHWILPPKTGRLLQIM
jgi:hypothetical protein